MAFGKVLLGKKLHAFILPAAIGWRRRRKEIYYFLERNSQIFPTSSGILWLWGRLFVVGGRNMDTLFNIPSGEWLVQGRLSTFPSV